MENQARLTEDDLDFEIGLLGNRLTFIYKNKRGYLLDEQTTISKNQLTAHLQTTEDDAETFVLYK
ncbi:MAG: hypothetical protein A2X18_07155 [Bacteroidetes bacterium GWF2_40_14]|jgi:hypothetical protein|nr:MAG: hypothetical protein A2X18_07155 [Bacteroidetes bacterium GWF2_40_14]